MKRNLAICLALLALFFAIPFPMLLYYSIKSEIHLDIEGSDTRLSLGLVALSVVFWTIILFGFYRKWVLRVFSAKRNIERLKKNGIYREALILKSINRSTPNAKYNSYELSLEFKNLVDTVIMQKADVNDMKPHEHRFKEGKKVGLLIDNEVKHKPYFIFENTETSIHKGRLVLIHLGWLLLLILITGYYIYSYRSESEGMGWRFMSFWHPLLICPAILLFYNVLARLLDGKISGVPNEPLIKFKGKKTTAKLLTANLTGIYINQQPLVNFQLEFVDHQNCTHIASIKKIVSLLDLDSTKQKTFDIFYLREAPLKIAFANDLNEVR
ncbi:hypothetical protein HDF22_005566 [Mucilaginibacter lappiensis]|nr:hypothetical protein [Mucilaginibacter lappiensis]MBB6131415.1 hypothetical protein [Mucilaginibacter lappiensis]